MTAFGDDLPGGTWRIIPGYQASPVTFQGLAALYPDGEWTITAGDRTLACTVDGDDVITGQWDADDTQAILRHNWYLTVDTDDQPVMGGPFVAARPGTTALTTVAVTVEEGVIVSVDLGERVYTVAGISPDADGDIPVEDLAEAVGGGVTVHNNLTGRSTADAHPQSAITGLTAALTAAGIPFGTPEVCPIGELTDWTDPADYGKVRTAIFGRSENSNIHSALRLANPATVAGAVVFVGAQAAAVPGCLFWRDDTATAATLNLGGVGGAAFGLDADYTGTPLLVTWNLDGDEYETNLTADYGTIGGGNIATFLGDLIGPVVAEGVTYDETFTLTSPTTGASSVLEVVAASGPPGDPVVAALLAATATPGYAGTVHGIDDAGMALGSEDYFPDDLILGGGTHNHPDNQLAIARGTIVVALPAIGDDGAKWSALSHPLRESEIVRNLSNLKLTLDDHASRIAALEAGGGGVSEEDMDTAIAAAIDALVGGAPGALDTLNELAAALGDDASFAASVTTALAGKASTSHASTHAPGGSDALPWNRTIGFLPSGRIQTSSVVFGTPLIDAYATTTQAIALGQLVGGFTDGRRGTTAALHFETTASALTSGQTVYLVRYALDADGLPTGSPTWSETPVVGTTVGKISAVTVRTFTGAREFLGVLNPSTNAGTVTVRAANGLLRGIAGAPSLNSRHGLMSASSFSSPPDVTNWKVDSSPASAVWGLTAVPPLLFATS